MTRVYTQDLLKALENRDGFTTIESPSELKQGSRIVFTCSCGKRGDKTFRCINIKGGGFCTECVKIGRASCRERVSSPV